MTGFVEIQETRHEWEIAQSKPLDEAVWQAWLAKGRGREIGNSARRAAAAELVSIAALLAAAGQWSQQAPFDSLVRFIVCACALVVVFHSFHARRYAFAAVFGAMVLLYNPLAPIFAFSGEWQRAVVIASAVPFVTALTWRTEKLAGNV